MSFIIEKLKIKEGCESGVRRGSRAVGSIFLIDSNGDVLENASIADVEVGHCVFIGYGFWDFIKTSVIINIVERSDKHVIFETGSSIYEIREVTK